MKRINKLTLSALALPIAVVPAITITSCNKKPFDGRLTQEEIATAFNKVIDYTAWNYSCNQTVKIVYPEEEEAGTININFTPKGVAIFAPDEPNLTSYFLPHNNAWYSIIYDKQEETSIVGEELGNNPNIDESLEFNTLFWFISDSVPKMPFSEEYKGYYYSFTDEETQSKFILFIKFNSDKNLESATLYAYGDSQEIQYSIQFYDYGITKEIDIPATVKEKTEYPGDSQLTWNSAESCYESKVEPLHCSCVFTPSSDTTINTISLYMSDKTTLAQQGQLMQAEIYVNDVKQNCTISKVEGKAQLTIKDGLKLKNGQNVQIVWNGSLPVSSNNRYFKVN